MSFLSNPKATPMVLNTRLSTDDQLDVVFIVDPVLRCLVAVYPVSITVLHKQYHGMVGKLGYIMNIAVI